MNIKAILSRLSREDGEMLSCALESGITNLFVEYRPGRFIGVNILPDLMPNLVIEKTAGVYSAGAILRGDAVSIFNGDE